jgi:DNA-binding response OmpR family regulator
MGEDHFDAVVLDLGLPDGLGGAVLRKLQDVSPKQRPAWVIISALDEDEAVHRYGSLKGPFIPKPFDPWDLIRKLEQLLAARPAGSERSQDDHPPTTE